MYPTPTLWSAPLLYLRSLLFLGIMIFSIPPFIIFPILAWPLPFPKRFAIIRSWAGFTLWWLKYLCRLDYRVEGLENLPSGSAIVFSKHQSVWETLALQRILPPFVWVLKRELLWVPFFGWGLAATDPIAIDRSAGRKALHALLQQGKQRLAAGRWIVIFPEGTRVLPGQHRDYAIGGAMLAERSGGVPVVPIAHNAGEYWSRRAFLKLPGTITVVIGKPIPTAGRKAAEINADAREWIEATVARISNHAASPESTGNNS